MFIQQPFNLTGGVAAEAAYVPKGAVWFDGAADEMTRTMSTGTEEVFTISFWEKLAEGGTSGQDSQFSAASTGAAATNIEHDMTTDGMLYFNSSVDNKPNVKTTAAYRDPSAWRHVFIAYDSTPATPGINSIYIAVNGVIQTDLRSPIMYPAQNGVTDFNTARVHYIGSRVSNRWFNGYLSEFVFLNGVAALPSDFGEENSDGVWVPKDPTDIIATASSTNTFWLDFADSANLGNDVSTNGNHFTAVSMDATNWTYDRPVNSGSDTGNYCTANTIGARLHTTPAGDNASWTWTNGNLTGSHTASGGDSAQPFTQLLQPGNKYHFEYTLDTAEGIYAAIVTVLCPLSHWEATAANPQTQTGSFYATIANGSSASNSAAFSNSALTAPTNKQSAGDRATFEVDMSTIGSTEIKLFYNGSLDTTWSSMAFTDEPYVLAWSCGTETDRDGTCTWNFGQSGFDDTPSAGFKAMSTATMSAPSIKKPSDQFLPIVYEGNGGGQRVGNFIPFTDVYAVDNSCVFDDNDSDYLTRTPGTPTSSTVGTFSFWIKRGVLGAYQTLLQQDWPSGNEAVLCRFNSDDTFLFRMEDTSGNYVIDRSTKRIFKNPSSWVHIHVSWDSALSTNSACTVTINGAALAATDFNSPINTGGTSTFPNTTNVAAIGRHQAGANYYLDGYLSEVVFIDGSQQAVSSFGQTDTSTNRWIPKDVSGLTFGDEGFYLEFGTAADLGDDTSGETNDWTESGSLGANNQTIDTPTKNYCTWNPLNTPSGMTFSNGNLQLDSTTNWYAGLGTMQISSGKWYWEVNVGTATPGFAIGVADAGTMGNATDAVRLNGWSYSYSTDQRFDHSSTGTAYAAPSTPSSGDVFQVALDMDNGTIFIGQNNTWLQSSNPSTGASPMFSNVTGTVVPGYDMNLTSNAAVANFGQNSFAHTPPTDFVALNQDNLAANTAGITGFSWIKNRDATADSSVLVDRVRGVYDYIESDDTQAEVTDTNSVQRFLQQGVQVGNMDAVNASAESCVLWQWAANGTGTSLNVATADVNGATSSTTALVVDGNSGTIEAGMYVAGTGVDDGITVASLSDQNNLVLSSAQSLSNDVAITFSTSAGATLASTVSANTTAGFSVIQWSGTGANATIGHGLGSQIPKFWAVKNTATTNGWMVGHASLANTSFLQFNNNDVVDTSGATAWNSTYPAADIISLGSNAGSNGSGYTNNMICYAWAEVEGYSKFESYIRNGVVDGPFINLGFKPAWLMVKRTDVAGDWEMRDFVRDPYNPVTHNLRANEPDPESPTADAIDFTSTGFKIRNTSSSWNATSGTGNYVYIAFAENPFGGSGVAPANAR